MPEQKRSNLLQFALIFAVVYMGSQLVLRTFFPQKNADTAASSVILRPADGTVTEGHHPILVLENNTAQSFAPLNRCPHPPVDVFRIDTANGTETLVPLDTTETAVPCERIAPIPAGDSAEISLASWKYSLFSALGTYEVRLPAGTFTGTGELMLRGTGTGAVVAPPDTGLSPTKAATQTISASTRFSMTEPGTVTKLFRTFITAPFLNFLIFIASLLPDHNLGIAIILLTVVVKLLLFYPTQKALQGQRKMQAMQPKVDALKERYKADPKRIQEETMKLWKEHKINPFTSCLPTLIQFPVLIGLFYVIRDGSSLALSRHLIYPMYQHLSWTFGIHFLGLDLLLPSLVMPPILVLLQFFQMKLTFTMNERKKAAKDGIIDVTPGKKAKTPASPQAMQQKIMLYGLPLMIGFFALKFPAAVSVYWGVSTLFGIGQQWVVNRKS